jgi:enamine deaminase RidA (YjgF/YER057c/UK114 family)
VSAEENIKKLNIVLPEPKAPVGSYLATKISGNLLFISGQISTDNKGQLIKGKIGDELNTEQGYEAAVRCGLSLISQAKKACNGDLSKITSCIKLTGYVNSTSDYIDQPKIVNGASEIITKILGDKGLHTRAAISANSLPLGVAVEVDGIFEIK